MAHSLASSDVAESQLLQCARAPSAISCDLLRSNRKSKLAPSRPLPFDGRQIRTRAQSISIVVVPHLSLTSIISPRPISHRTVNSLPFPPLPIENPIATIFHNFHQHV